MTRFGPRSEIQKRLRRIKGENDGHEVKPGRRCPQSRRACPRFRVRDTGRVTRDEALRHGLSVELSAQGLGVRWLDDIAALKSALTARLPSFLILDFDPAVEPPWKELSDLRGDPAAARLPAIAISGTVTAPRYVVEVMRMGIMDYVRKPCDPIVLVLGLQALRAALTRRDPPRRGESCYQTADGAWSC